VNGTGGDAARLRADVRAALAGGDLQPVVADLLELRFPAEGHGASLDEAGAALGMSPALVAHIEFGALWAIAARLPRPRATTTTAGNPAGWPGRPRDGRGRA
jgi:hypothetical protein